MFSGCFKRMPFPGMEMPFGPFQSTDLGVGGGKLILRRGRGRARALCRHLDSGENKPIHINNFSGLSREWVGVKFVYVLPFSWGRRKHITNLIGNLRNMPGQSRDSPGIIPAQSRAILPMCFLFIGFFFLPLIGESMDVLWFKMWRTTDSTFSDG